VRTAFWLKEPEEPLRYLYLATEGIDDGGLRDAYAEVLRLARENRSPYLNPFRVKVIDAKPPPAEAAAWFNDREPSTMATRLRDEAFGGICAENVDIDPRVSKIGANGGP
jgi:hypothetical protein